MNQNVAEIALMFILPLGVTFITILQAASAEYRYQKVTGALFAFIVVVMDCLFYFTRNSFISYNTDGGLLLAFASLFFFGLLYVVRSNDRAEKCANIMFSAFMLAAFIGIAYWERPTLLVASEFSPEEIAAQNAKYQDYIESFQNGGSGGTWKTAPRAAQASGGTVVNTPGEKVVLSSAAKSRLDRYIGETDKVIARMYEIMVAIDSYEPIAPSITDAEREQRGSQALAINNNATALNKKALGLFHPHESSEAHTELIQATESLRLAAYSLYTYSLQEDTEEQMNQYKQSRSQIAQTKIYLERFRNDIQNLISNYQPQQEEN
ncbi:hypothetical protein [uncultured Fibrobacter sp.]|uniref:hypothetical protein n=1 Tax=uncultured Fibrobacter sp. TaxID=261512 RepID=UPI0025F1200A|nr:hypothetical protein [uncultured Fibrobacter sp.]